MQSMAATPSRTPASVSASTWWVLRARARARATARARARARVRTRVRGWIWVRVRVRGSRQHLEQRANMHGQLGSW